MSKQLMRAELVFLVSSIVVGAIHEGVTLARPYCPPGSTAPICIHPNPPRPPPAPPVSTLVELDFKRWNGNPVSPGCKNDAILSFQVPAGTTLESITIGETSCSIAGTDVEPGQYIDTHVAADIRAGAVSLNHRPSHGTAAGPKSLSYHWWFNQWGHVQFHLCINVRHAPGVSVPKADYFDHLDMNDGLKAYRINTPLCVDHIGVKANIDPQTGNVEVKPDASVKGCDHGSVWWFGCKNDKGIPVTF